MESKQPAKTRDKLIDVTIEALWRQNCLATGVDQLCKAADIRKGSFYHHFKTKSELVVAAIWVAWERAETKMYKPALAAEPHSLSQLHAFASSVLALQRQCHEQQNHVLGCPFGNLGHEMAVHDEDIRYALEKIFDAQVKIFEEALNGIAEAGGIPPGDNHRRAINLVSFIEGSLMMARIYNEPELFQCSSAAMDAIAKA